MLQEILTCGIVSTIISSVISWRNKRSDRLITCITQNRMKYISELRSHAIKFCTIADADKPEKERLAEEYYALQFYLNQTGWEDWDAYVGERTCKIYGAVSKGKGCKDYQQELSELVARLQSLLGAEWRGMTKEAWLGRKLNSDENQEILNRQLQEETSNMSNQTFSNTKLNMRLCNISIALLFLFLFGIDCYGQQTFTSNRLKYQVVGQNSVCCLGFSNWASEQKEVEIPAEVIRNGITYKVASIGERAFSGKDSLRVVVLPKELDYIGKQAFNGTSIKKIHIGKVGRIYENAFGFIRVADSLYIEEVDTLDYDCLNAVNIIILKGKGIVPKNLTNNYLQTLTLGEGFTEISNSCFAECKKLRVVNLPSTLKTIGNAAFSGTALERIKIPASVTTIGTHAFYNCKGLHDVIIEDSPDTLYIGYDDASHREKSDTTTLWQACIDSLYIGRNISCPYRYFDSPSIRRLAIGENVGKLEADFAVFYATDCLADIYVPWKTDIKARLLYPYSCFNSRTFKNATLHVPLEAEDLYKKKHVSFWLYFDNIDARRDQEITWNQSDGTIIDRTVIFPLTAKAILPVTYKVVSGGNAAEIVSTDNGYGLKAQKGGVVIVEALQGGNEAYKPAVVKQKYFIVPYKKSQIIKWTTDSVQCTVADTVLLQPTTTAGLPITYENINGVSSTGAEIKAGENGKLFIKDGNTYFIPLSQNISILRGSQPGNDEYDAVTSVERIYADGYPHVVSWDENQLKKVAVGDSILLNASSSAGCQIDYSIRSNPYAKLVENDGKHYLKGNNPGKLEINAYNLPDKNNYYAIVAIHTVFTVVEAKQTITWNQPETSLKVGESVTLSATASSGLPVSYQITEGSSYAEIAESNGVYTLKTLQAGLVTIVASQAGNSEYDAAEGVTMQFTIGAKKTQTITWNQDIEIAKGTTLAMQAVSSSGLPVTYTSDKPEGAFALPTSISDAEIVFDAPGPYILYAHQEGNDEYEAAEPVKMEFNVLDEKYDDLMYIDGIYYRYADGNKNSLMAVRGYKKYVGDVVIPEYVNGLPVVTIDGQTFYACYGLNSVVVGENVNLMGHEAFGACKNLSSVTIPSECDIADWCYNASPNIKEIHCHATTPYNVREYIFNGYTDYTTCILYVPRGTKELYELADVWKNFTNIVEEDQPSGISTATWANGEVNIYTLSGLLVRAKAKDTRGLRPGIYIAGGKKLVVR